MARIIKTPLKETKEKIRKELTKFALPNRNPNNSTEKLFGLWEGRDISIEKIRRRNIHKPITN